MKSFIYLLSTLFMFCVSVRVGFTQGVGAPAGVSSGLFAWYDAANFDVAAQRWPPKVGATVLESFSQTNAAYARLNQYEDDLNRNFSIVMEGRGFRAEMLPNDPEASYTIFAVCRRNSTSAGTYQQMSWGIGGLSAYPGVTVGEGSVQDNRFKITNNRTVNVRESRPSPKGFKISSFTFSYGLNQRNLPKIASISGESAAIDAGNTLAFNNGWVYINANAAFPPGEFEQRHEFAEFIIYNRRLSDAERQRVETYLSLRYSLPLTVGIAGGGRYTLNGTNDLWDQTRAFNHHIVGIGRNDALGLDIRHSWGGVYPEVLLETRDPNTRISTDNAFLLIGDKGTYHEYANETNTVAMPGGKRLKRIWRVQNSGVSDSVQVFMASLVAPEGGLSLDPCAPVRLLVSADSTFATYTAYPLTPALIYENPTTPTLFSSYRTILRFSQGESFVTLAAINSPGTPAVAAADVHAKQFTPCVDEEGFSYLLNADGRPLIGIKGLTGEELAKAKLEADIRVLDEPARFSNGASTATLMRRLVTVSSLGTLPSQPNMTVRYYFTPEELTDAQLPDGTGTWFKKEGSAAATLADFADDGKLTTGVTTNLLVVNGDQNGVSYVEFRRLTSFSTFGFTSSVTSLPVTLESFGANPENGVTQLSWKTSSEVDALSFEIQRSSDAAGWEPVGLVPVAAGDFTAPRNYSVTDHHPLKGINYYRLKITDRDGSFALSKIVTVLHRLTSDEDAVLYPNPSKNSILFRHLPVKPELIDGISICDINGREALRSGVNISGEVDISSLPTGIYMVRVTLKNGGQFTRKLIVDR
ncbi:hypothetical protein GCM10023091_03660 [Ravibacter arvi]|uniref:Secretion system C-terminal sorting domain-containing protein n=1 Tax=Ravibacter arvi TaxID=2051041 RepID=A0ABP8LMY8_9BACT